MNQIIKRNKINASNNFLHSLFVLQFSVALTIGSGDLHTLSSCALYSLNSSYVVAMATECKLFS